MSFSRCSGSIPCVSCNREESNANSTFGPEVDPTRFGRLLPRARRCALLACFTTGVILTGLPASSHEPQAGASLSKVMATQLLALPMQFEANAGQVDGHVEFLSRGQGYTLWLTKTQAVLSLRASNSGGEPGNTGCRKTLPEVPG